MKEVKRILAQLFQVAIHFYPSYPILFFFCASHFFSVEKALNLLKSLPTLANTLFYETGRIFKQMSACLG